MAAGPVKKLSGAVASAPSFFAKLRSALAPWSLTGPASSGEFKMSLTTPDQYRPFAPSSPPVEVKVPHARPETTFDIKYFTRERRRVHDPAVTLAPLKQYVVDPRTAEPVSGAALPGVRSRLQQGYAAGGVKTVSLLDDANNGYTS